MCKNAFVAKGSGGVEANNRRAEDATQQAYNRTLGFQGQYDTFANKLNPTWQSMLSRISGGATTPGSMWNVPTTPSTGLPTTPTLSWYAPSTEIQGQINPDLDIPTWGKRLEDAFKSSSTALLNDDYNKALSDTRAINARRGLSDTSFAPGSLATLSIQRNKTGAQNMANAILQRYNMEQAWRGEQSAGAQALANLLRQAELDKTSTAQQGYENVLGRYITGNQLDTAARAEGKSDYWNQVQVLIDELKRRGVLGDTTGAAANFSNIAQNYGQMGANQMAGLSSLISAAASMYGGMPSKPKTA